MSVEIQNMPRFEPAKGEAPWEKSLNKSNIGNGKADINRLMEQLNKQEEHFKAIFVASLKYQSIDGENSTKPSEILAAASAVLNSKTSMMTAGQLIQAAETMQKAMLVTASQMVGQHVGIEDSVQQFSGQPIKFGYEITGNKALEANMVVNIEILTEEGRSRKFSQKVTNAVIGKNEFEWNGKDDQGNKVENGKYKINVTAHSAANGKKTTLNVSTARNGTITGVDIDNSTGEISAIVDDKKTAWESIVSFHPKAQQEETKTNLSDYSHYMGKTVATKQDKVDFAGNKNTKLGFIAHGKRDQANVRVDFYDQHNKFVARAETVQDVADDENEFIWDGAAVRSTKEKEEAKELIQVPHGTYSYKVYLGSADQTGKVTYTQTPLANTKDYDITGLAKPDGKKVYLLAGQTQIDPRSVTGYNEKPTTGGSYSSRLGEAQKYAGKVVTYYKNQMPQDNIVRFALDKPAAGQKLGDVTLEIFDKTGAQIKTITKPQAEVYYQTQEPVPTYAELNKQSQARVNTFSQQHFKQDYEAAVGKKTDKSGDNKKLLDQFIEQGFRGLSLFHTSYDGATDESKAQQRLKNQGLMEIKWDGNNKAGVNVALLNSGFTIAIKHDTVDATGKVIKQETLNLLVDEQVLRSGVDQNGEIFLEFNGGIIIPLSEVRGIRG